MYMDTCISVFFPSFQQSIREFFLLWQNEKVPVTSIFSFSHNDPENNEFVLYGKQHNVGKGENAGNIFSFLYAH